MDSFTISVADFETAVRKHITRSELTSLNADEVVSDLKSRLKTDDGDGYKTYNSKVYTDALLNLGRRSTHPQYGKLAALLFVDRLHATTHPRFSRAMAQLAIERKRFLGGDAAWNDLVQHRNGSAYPGSVIDEKMMQVIYQRADDLDSMIDTQRDYEHSFRSLIAYYDSYLTRKGKANVVERPQYLAMRVALFIAIRQEEIESTPPNDIDLAKVQQFYEAISSRRLSFATPILCTSSLSVPYTNSCFVIETGDNMESLSDMVNRATVMSQSGGGVGCYLGKVRACGQPIGNSGVSDGVMSQAIRLNSVPDTIMQRERQRPAAVAIWLPDWHADFSSVLQSRMPRADSKLRTLSLFHGLWMSDEFYRRVEAGEMWSFMSPDVAPGLDEVFGDDFVKLYRQYEAEGRYSSQRPAKDVLIEIGTTQATCGMPFICNKDAFNRRTNQSNIGVIKSSNICTEIGIVFREDMAAVCNLATVCLPQFVDDETIDWNGIVSAAGLACIGLNNVIDKCDYRLESKALVRDWRRPVNDDGTAAENIISYPNKSYRPVGIGIQGMADLLFKLGIPYDSAEATELAGEIMEAVYYGALGASNDLAREYGPYESYSTSNYAKGIYQFDHFPDFDRDRNLHHDRFDWTGLFNNVKQFGLRNSLLTAQPPTASTSLLSGCVESAEAMSSNRYTRGTRSGTHDVFNNYMVADLQKLGLWDVDMERQIVEQRGSIQDIDGIPNDIKLLYKTAYEINQERVIDHSAARARFMDQSESLNHHCGSKGTGTVHAIIRALLYGWKSDLKTAQYYLRTLPASHSANFNRRAPSTVNNTTTAVRATTRSTVVNRTTNKQRVPSVNTKEVSDHNDDSLQSTQLGVCFDDNRDTDCCLTCSA